MKGLFVQKIGMTRMFDEATGELKAVTVLHAPKNAVLQEKTKEVDGYNALVLGAFKKNKKHKNTNKNFAKVGEFRNAEKGEGEEMSLADFADAKNVQVVGYTKGRGFAGVVKRHNFKTGRNTHGSHHHREPGSVGQATKPGRIFKGKKMPGHYGVDRKTIQCQVAKIDTENEAILVYGSVPGPQKGYLMITTTA